MALVVKCFPRSRSEILVRFCCVMLKTFNGGTTVHFYSTHRLNSAEYKECYSILNLKPDSDQETVRQAFLQLAKRYHPDSGSDEADAIKFQEVEKAFCKLQQKFHAERWSDRRNEGAGEYGLYYKEKKNNDDTPVVQLDIKHTAPQHRQYLSYDGVGVGTPAQRHKQYQKLRASTAVENVYNHRISKVQQAEALDEEQALVVKDKQRAKNIKTRYGIDRLVEDLIQESMAKGDFDNLSGKGKPLSKKHDHYNPYVDLVTHKINQVMIDNGFMPEWITLQKEIREEVQQIREELVKGRDRLMPSQCEEGLSDVRWTTFVDTFREDVRKLNSKIGKFNLVVPLLPNQMLLFDLDKEALKIKKEPPKERVQKPTLRREEKAEDGSLLHAIMSIFNR